MAQSVIGALRANLGLDSAQFTRGMTQAQRSLQRARRQFLAVTGVVAAFGAALTRVALRGAADIDRIVKAARRIDGSAGSFQALELAAGEAGVSLSALTNDLQTLNRELSSGSAGAVRAMDRLGMSAQDLLAMDADDRVAAIADRIQEMGMSAAEASVLLRDLGVRNREMVLMMIRGGDAIRAAREDIRDYGLEIDEALGANVERARDQISRLSIVTQYFGQRVAAEVVPSLGAFAQVITDSMREGGLLRGVIDGLVGNIGALVSIGTVAVVLFGVRYVAALVAARAATIAFTSALLRTGIGALVVGAGFLLDLMLRLRVATGNWAEAFSLAVDVIRESFGRVVVSLAVWESFIVAAAQTARAAFLGVSAGVLEAVETAVSGLTRGVVAMVNVAIDALETMTNRARVAVNTLIEGLNNVPGVNISVLQDVSLGRVDAPDGDSIFGQIAAGQREMQREAQAAADQAVRTGEAFRRMAQLPLGSIARMRDVLAGTTDETGDAADEARRLAEELGAIADGDPGGGGGGARGAAAAVDDLTDSVEGLTDGVGQVNSIAENAFVGFVTGAQSARQAIASLLRDLARLAAQSAFRSLSGGLAGSTGGTFSRLVGGLFGGGGIRIPGFATGVTNFRGGLARINEAGGEIVNLPSGANVIPHDLSKDMLRGQAAEPVQVVVRLDPSAEFDSRVAQTAGAVVSVEGPRVVRNEVASGGVDRPMARFGMKPQRLRR